MLEWCLHRYFVVALQIRGLRIDARELLSRGGRSDDKRTKMLYGYCGVTPYSPIIVQ